MSDPWARKIPWRRKWQPTPVFLPGKSHGQRRLAGYGPWVCKALDTTEQLKNEKNKNIQENEEPGLAFLWVDHAYLTCSSITPYSVHIFIDVAGEIIVTDV